MNNVCFLILSLVLVGVYSEESRNSSIVQLTCSNCGAASNPVKIILLQVSPNPFNIPGIITLNAKIQVDINISAPIKADVMVKRKSFLQLTQIPCLNNVGSCRYEDICALSPFGNNCPQIFQVNSIPCSCPINKGVYSVKDFHFPINAAIPLKNVKYQMRISLSSASQSLGCFDFQLDFK